MRCQLLLRFVPILIVSVAIAAQPAVRPALDVSGADRRLQPGDVARLSVAVPARSDAVVGRVWGHDVPFYAGADGMTWFALLGVDLETKPGTYSMAVSAAHAGKTTATATRELHVDVKEFPTRRLSVAGRFVDPPLDQLDRIKHEAEQLAAVFRQVTPRRWDGPFNAPVPGTPSSNVGARSVYNGRPRSMHAGVDFGGEVGTPIAAPNAGQVVLAEDLFFTGGTVVLDHGLGLYSLFAHLSRIDVMTGETMTKGGIVGRRGATGRVTGPHLHWAVRLNGARVDPLSLIAALEN